MIIKKWSGSAWAEQYPKTTVADIYLADGTTAAFSGGKILESLLPNSVFDSLHFFSTISASDDLFDVYNSAVADASSVGRSVLGYYWVASSVITLTPNSPQLLGGVYIGTNFTPADGRIATTTSAVTVEIGDWFVITKVTGEGTVGDPYLVTFAVVNNTYEDATSTVSGIMKIFDNTQQSVAANAVSTTASRTYGIQLNSSGQAVVNVPWVDTNTTYSAGTGLTLAGTTFAANLIDSTLRSVTAETITTTASRTYAIMPDADGDLVVNVPWVDTNTTYTAGSGLTLAGTVFSHTDTSSAANLSATSRTYVTGLTFDTYGHVTAYTTAAETVVDTNTTYTAGSGLSLTGTVFANTAPDQTVSLTGGGATSIGGTYPNFTISSTNTTYTAGNGISLSGTAFSVAGGEGLTQEASGLKMTYPVYWHASSLPTSGVTTGSIGFEG